MLMLFEEKLIKQKKQLIRGNIIFGLDTNIYFWSASKLIISLIIDIQSIQIFKLEKIIFLRSLLETSKVYTIGV